jgi:hypothetical protein
MQYTNGNFRNKEKPKVLMFFNIKIKEEFLTLFFTKTNEHEGKHEKRTKTPQLSW